MRNIMNMVKHIALFIVYLLSTLFEDVDSTCEITCSSERCKELRSEITDDTIDNLFKNISRRVDSKQQFEAKLASEGRVVGRNERKADPSLIRKVQEDPEIRNKENVEIPFEHVTNELAKMFNLTKCDIDHCLPKFPFNGQFSKEFKKTCENSLPSASCDELSKYRTASGQCNNLNHPNWGMSLTCQQRILPANYIGSSGYRRSVTGQPLPSPRKLSLNLHFNLNRPTNNVNHLYLFFGQMLDHDFSLTPASVTVDNQAIQCCPPSPDMHPQCAPILISKDDPFYSKYGVTCLNFVRSSVCLTCSLGHRQQFNVANAFIDASFTYGTSENETRSLRTNDGTGRLKVQESLFGDLLPRIPEELDRCSFPKTNDFCFLAGDPRVNQNSVLSSLQTVYAREHNRLAFELSEINPHWEEETIFQEARRILGAEMQAIVFKEYLPITLGSMYMTQFKLWISKNGRTKYVPDVNPAIFIEFSTGGFRFAHSMINSLLSQYPTNSTGGLRLLKDDFFQPFGLYKGYLGPLLRGTSGSPAQTFDRHLVPDVTNFLYRSRHDRTGLDLASSNINRGRDHGLPTYVEMVCFCSKGTINIERFMDLITYGRMQREEVEALRKNYKHVKDVDLWPGIILEKPSCGAVVGPTAACIIGLQFHNLKYGDRYYFEHGNETGSFTYQQLQELKKVTLTKLICLNSQARHLPRTAMLFESYSNPLVNCTNVKGIDLSYWKE